MSELETFADGEARIIDRGYRRYDGPRRGVRGAMAAVTVHSLQRALGLRRTFWAKLLPIVVIAMAYVPAIVFVGAVALLPDADARALVLPSYGDYYGFVISALMVFVGLVAPEVLCTDRRTGMLGVYLAAPLDRDTYLTAKAAAIAAALSLVCLGPPLLMLIANLLQNQGPEGIADIADTTLRVLVCGVVLTAMFTGLTMGITSLTDRKAVAAASIILLFLVSLTVASTIAESGGPEGAYAWSPTSLSLELAQRVHGEYSPIMSGVPGITVWGAWALWTFGGFALARWRLHVLPVTR